MSAWAIKDYQAHRFAQDKDRMQNLEKAAALQPGNADFWHQLGVEYLKQKPAIHAKALEAFQKAVDLSPTYARYWFSLGRLQYRMGRRSEAIAALERAVAWAPYKSGYSLHLIAVYLEESEKLPEQRDAFLNKASELSKQLFRKKSFPPEHEQKRWMGETYAEKFRNYIPLWSQGGGV